MNNGNPSGRRSASSAFIALAAAVGLLSSPAWAYIDPGTGSYLIQVMMAVFLGSLFVLKSFWKRSVRKIARIFSKRPDERPPDVGL
jgi:hypothetical protein